MANSDIDIALDALCRNATNEQTLSRGDIADVCGCSMQNIQQIEERAINRLKKISGIFGLDDYLEGII